MLGVNILSGLCLPKRRGHLSERLNWPENPESDQIMYVDFAEIYFPNYLFFPLPEFCRN